MAARGFYVASCGTCYSGASIATASKAKADRHAVGHMNAYPGHPVSILGPMPKKDAERLAGKSANPRQEPDPAAVIRWHEAPRALGELARTRVNYEGGRFLLSSVLSDLSQAERDAIDEYLVRIGHPIAWKPGRQDERIAAAARELAARPGGQISSGAGVYRSGRSKNPGDDSMTAAARDGWKGINRPPYASSPVGMAWSVGARLRALGHPEPKAASMSRGYKVRIDGAVHAAPTEYEANPAGAGRRAKAPGSKRASRHNQGALINVLTDALASILNVEHAAILGGREGAMSGLDVPWHFEKVRSALAAARSHGFETNPASAPDDSRELEEAAAMFERFHGHKPTKAHRVKLPHIGKHLVALGTALDVSYDSAKWRRDGKKKGYIHTFTSAPHVATNPAGSVLIIFGGKMRVKPEGITG